MKVIILTDTPFPNGMAATNRIKCYARAIKDGGLDCEIVIRGITEKKGRKIRNKDAVGLYEGIPFHYMGNNTTGSGFMPLMKFAQLLNHLRTARYLKNNLQRGDILFLYMGNKVKQMMHYMKIAHNNGAYCVRDLCELPYGVGAETNKAISMRKLTLEKQFPKLDGIVSISDALLRLAKEYAQPTCKHIKVPIMVEYEYYKMQDRSAESDVPYIFHAGTLYEQKDGILGMIEAFGLAIQKINYPIKFVLTGNLENSPHRDKIKHLVAQYNLENNLQFTGYLNNEDLKNYLCKASMVIINKYPTQQNNHCFSTKLGEYLAAAKPVVITNVGEAVNWLKDRDSAYIIEPEDTNALANAIVQVFSNPDEARQIGRAGQELCQHSFDYRVWSKPLILFLKQFSEL